MTAPFLDRLDALHAAARRSLTGDAVYPMRYLERSSLLAG